MIKVGRAFGLNFYVDTTDENVAARAGMLISRALNPDGEWDFDRRTNQFIARIDNDLTHSPGAITAGMQPKG